MHKVEDYLEHAAECRQMAGAASNQEHREMLLQMAQTWESLAHDRREQIARGKHSAVAENLDETS